MIRIICTSIIKKFIFGGIFFLFFFVVSVNEVFAAIEVSQTPTEVEINKEFSINVLLTGISGSHRIGIAIHKNEGDSYFGLTKSGDQWVEMEDENCNSLPLATAQESSWSGQLVGKIIYGEKDFDGSLGSYILKVVKYTQSSCDGGKSKTYSDGVTVNLIDLNPPSPTPTPTTPVPTPTEPAATPTSSPPTATPTLTPTPQPPTNTPTPRPTLIPTIKPTPTFSIVLKPTENLGFGTEPSSDLSAEEILGMEASSGGEASLSSGFAGFIKNIPWFPVIAVGIGVLFIGFSLFTFIKGNRKIPPPNL